MDDLIYKKIMNQIDLLDYFLPETISYLTKQEKVVEKEFAENRRNGANHSEICRLIQKDLDQDFNSYINENNIPLFLTKINHSKFETNSFLLAKQEELTIIEYAAFCGSFKIFCYMQEKGAICDPSIWIYAIHGNNLNILKKLIKDGIIPNDESYKECFEESIKCYHNEIAKYIHENLMKENSINIEKLIDLNNFEFIPSNLDKESLFNCFCRNGYLYLVESLINNIDVNKKVNEKTALYEAIEKENLEIIQLLLNKKEIDVNIKSTVTFEKLMKSRADCATFKCEVTPLYQAIEKENPKIVELLLLNNQEIQVNLKSIIHEYIGYQKTEKRHEITPLNRAIKGENLDIIQLLLSRKEIDVNLKSTIAYDKGKMKELNKETTPLYKAIKKGNLQIVQFLLNRKEIDVNLKSEVPGDKDDFHYRERCNKTPLYQAIEQENLEIFELLLNQENINVNLTSEKYFTINNSAEQTPLYEAIEKRNIKIVQLLLNRKEININYLSDNKTPICQAIEQENLEIIQLLVDQSKLNVNLKSKIWDDHRKTTRSNKELTPLFQAVEKGNQKIVQLLLNRQDIDVNLMSKIFTGTTHYLYNKTPLYQAIENENQEIIQLLLSKKELDINIKITIEKNSKLYEKTPLYRAVEQENQQIIQLLLSRQGIDANLKSTINGHEQVSPIELALRKRNIEIIQLLNKKIDKK